MRREYDGDPLPDSWATRPPMDIFYDWFAQAEAVDPHMANTMTLATADAEGRPHARIVLLKETDSDAGFIFFTDGGSAKGRDLHDQPYAALVFHWASLDKQIRVEGRALPLPRNKVSHYFASRPRASQIAAFASAQSHEIKDRAQLETHFNQTATQFDAQPVPLPDRWTGYRLAAERIEFWQGRKSRLHDRLVFIMNDGSWFAQRLQP